MLKLSAPYPEIQKNLFLPDPEFRDSEALNASMTYQQTMSGEYFTYVISGSDLRTYEYTVHLTRQKFLEFKRFFSAYAADKIKIVDHDDNIRIGYILTNPFQNSSNRRGELKESGVLVDAETHPVTFQFETV